MSGRIGFALLLGFMALRTIAAPVLPEATAPWRIELVAEAPKIRHPSVVACAPDGRIFVAEDPMDISLPKANAAEGRILCLHPDGDVTVFAEKLFAVFGLQYLEGKVYVLHNPRFSVFDDDHGVGRNRRELIEQTLPDPSALNWNDHVPANFRLAMDGYFYVASGDKGLHGARGTDGSRADLFSGGIFRIRPDGSGLEVFCHGVRNILDVAINAEDEIFTYDNTDEHEWMGRLTHMVEAGFYGYPYDFIPRRPYTLWTMADFGAGAATGAFAYNEDALPPEFGGDLFLADFGKRQIMHVKVRRKGATYEFVSKEDLIRDPPPDFRPVGIALGPDGKSIYVCDWQHRDDKENVTLGRLFKLTWTGAHHSAPKPDWYLDSALRGKCEASTGELIRGLSHPAQSVRMNAQRRLAERKNAAAELVALLKDTNTNVYARCHALWALNSRLAGEEMLADSEPIVRRQVVRQLGESRFAGAVPLLLDRLNDADASVRFHAATALGRIGKRDAVPRLLSALGETDLFARFAVFTALNRIGTNSPETWPQIVRGLESADSHIRQGVFFALRETFNERLVESLANLFADPSKPLYARKDAAELLSALHHRVPGWNGQWWAYHPALQPPPGKTETWSGTERVLQALRSGLSDSDAELRRLCAEALGNAQDHGAAPDLRKAFIAEKDLKTRAAMLRTLGAVRDAKAIDLITEELEHPGSNVSLVAAVDAAEAVGTERAAEALKGLITLRGADDSILASAVAALGRVSYKPAAPSIRALADHPNPQVRARVLESLRQLQGEESLKFLEVAVTDKDAAVRTAAIKGLGELRSPAAMPALMKAYSDDKTRSDAFNALTRFPDERALSIYLDGLASRNAAERSAARSAITSIRDKVLGELTKTASSLSPQVLAELRQIYSGDKKAEGLFAAAGKQYSPEEYLEFAAQHGGDAARGQKLFSDGNGVNCIICHRVGGNGGTVGPDLSSIGKQFDRRALAESVLFPSKTVREGYQQLIVEKRDGEELSGIVKTETADKLVLIDTAAREHSVPRSEIKARRLSALSIMPEGLQAGMSLEEFADLIAYLETLRSEGKPDGSR